VALLEDIKNDILDPSIALTSIMRKAKVLAYKLKNSALKDWVDQELNGYQCRDTDLPPYRKFHTHSMGLFVTPSATITRSVPSFVLPEEYRIHVHQVPLAFGLRALESALVEAESDLKIPWLPELVELYNFNANRNMQLVGAHRVVPKQSIEHVLDTIRNRLLNFVLEIEELDPNAGDVPSIGRISPTTVGQIFYRCIMGDKHFVQGNQGSNIATGNSRISSSSARYQSLADAKAALDSLKQHIDEVDASQREEVLASIGLLIAAIEDSTIPKSRVVAAAETIANASDALKRALRDLAIGAAGSLGATGIWEGIQYALGAQ
jgi:hypothetical protein